MIAPSGSSSRCSNANADSRGTAPRLRPSWPCGGVLLTRPLLAMNRSRVDHLSGARDRLEVHVGAGNFDRHETLVLVERCRGLVGAAHVALAQLARRPGHEIV